MPRPARVLRVVARVLGVLVLLVAALVGTAYVQSERAMARAVAVPAHPAPGAAQLAATPDAQAALVARGARAVQTNGCAECHGADLGGAVLVDNALIGRLGGPNLTAGRTGGALDDAAWELALRHGVRPDGTPLKLMPSGAYAGMADAEVAAIAAYVRSLPAVARPMPALRVGPAMRVMHLLGKAELLSAPAIAARDGGRLAHVAVAPAGQPPAGH